MLKNARELTGFTVNATDGRLGTVQEVYFDDNTWTVRYLKAETGPRPARHVLIPVHAFKEPHWDRKEFDLNISKEKIHRSPGMDIDKPITFDYEVKLADYYEWPVYPSTAHEILKPANLSAKGMRTAVVEDELIEQQLLGVNGVAGYRVCTSSCDDIGTLADFVIDDIFWTIRYMAVALTGLPPGNDILVAPGFISDILPERSEAVVTVLKQNIMPNVSYNELDFHGIAPREKKTSMKRGAKIRGRV